MTKINLNNISMNYQLEGEGKTIVFVHGLSDSLKYWNKLTNELKNEYQILSFDLRGHGNSTDDDSQTTINLYQEDLHCLLKALDIENAVFIGLSLGGNIILDFAINHPEMVNGLIVMSSFPEHTEKLERIFDDFYDGIDKGFVEFYDTILPYTLTEDILVIAGAEDNLTDLAIQKKISDNIKDCELIVLDKTKHNILIGRNIAKVLDIINKFMLKIE